MQLQYFFLFNVLQHCKKKKNLNAVILYNDILQ